MTCCKTLTSLVSCCTTMWERLQRRARAQSARQWAKNTAKSAHYLSGYYPRFAVCPFHHTHHQYTSSAHHSSRSNPPLQPLWISTGRHTRAKGLPLLVLCGNIFFSSIRFCLGHQGVCVYASFHSAIGLHESVTGTKFFCVMVFFVITKETQSPP